MSFWILAGICAFGYWWYSDNDETPKRRVGCSQAQIDWIKSVEKAKGIKIDPYSIPDIGKVNGYCKETNTVYEFHEDYWHGNPRKYNHNEIHPQKKVSYGELYQKTLRRDHQIKALGYNLVVKWESTAP